MIVGAGGRWAGPGAGGLPEGSREGAHSDVSLVGDGKLLSDRIRFVRIIALAQVWMWL